MERSLFTGLLIFTLCGCGDDGGGTTDTDASGSTSTSTDPTTGSPTSTPQTSSSSSTDAADSSSSGDPMGSSTTSDEASSSGSSGSGSSSTGEVAFEMTSPSFAEGELFPFDMHICEGNVHPQLDWVGVPEGTMSFGIYFHDVTIAFEHSAIWNIPADATGVPAGIEDTAMPANVPGALQCQHWGQDPSLTPFIGPGPRYGYGGPGSCENVYQFTLYALDVATLDDEVTSESTRFDVRTSLEAHAIETVTLSGQTRGSSCIGGCTPTPE